MILMVMIKRSLLNSLNEPRVKIIIFVKFSMLKSMLKYMVALLKLLYSMRLIRWDNDALKIFDVFKMLTE